ncbi:hypothetical protein [Lentzea sp. NBRC 102530]|uniref:LGFP repeat-containing protein n=1 Tax=Lentzea sp. NBRC 102530 TaxID=3032201 RepID=UPI0024A54AFA|nr:hypothetical protein [Lentzea sp. NBRC 102530]GLY48076.1 hypothetical protein Lesp01_17320 [Lentzea sp. NBRC 102530]
MSRRAVSLVAAVAAATAGLLPIITSTAANAAPVVQQQQNSVTKLAAEKWEDSPVYKKWVALGGAAFAGDKVGEEVVQSDGIRYAKFSKNVVITWKDGVGAYWFSGAIAARWEFVSVKDGIASTVATMDQVAANRGAQAGAATAFLDGSSVYYSDAYGAYGISGTNRAKFWANGSITGRFGLLTSEEHIHSAGGKSQSFSEAVVFYKKDGTDTPYWISGALRDQYHSDGGPSGPAGWLTRDQVEAPGSGWTAGITGGTIYWSAATGAQRLTGDIEAKFVQQGGPGGHAGYPISGVKPVGTGTYAQFRNAVEIYHSAATGAHWLSGGLRDHLQVNGGVTGPLGFPTSDQFATTGRNGLYVLFGPSKVILWGPTTGARVVQDQYLAKLRADGDVRDYGLPETGIAQVGPYNFQQFQDASIFDGNGRNTITIGWDFRRGWWQLGGYSGFLGMATTDVYWIADGVIGQNFDGGYLYCDYNEGQCYYNTWNSAAAKTASADQPKVTLDKARAEGKKLIPTAKAPRK